MDLHQPTIPNEEQKKLKMHARDGEEDDTSYPSQKHGKQDLDLPKGKPSIENHHWTKLFDFKSYMSESPQVYENWNIQCKKDIEDCNRAYNEVSNFFKIKFGDLEKKQPSFESSEVMETIRREERDGRECLDKATEILPDFAKHLDTYIKFRDGPLLTLRDCEYEYDKKMEELAEIPNVGKMIRWLVSNIKDDKEIERLSGFTRKEIDVICYPFWKKYGFHPLHEDDDTMDGDQYGESEMNELLNSHKDKIKEFFSIRYNLETAKDNVQKHEVKCKREPLACVWSMRGYLEMAGHWLRIMCQQLEVLHQKDVILNGCESYDFFEDWMEACRH